MLRKRLKQNRRVRETACPDRQSPSAARLPLGAAPRRRLPRKGITPRAGFPRNTRTRERSTSSSCAPTQRSVCGSWQGFTPYFARIEPRRAPSGFVPAPSRSRNVTRFFGKAQPAGHGLRVNLSPRIRIVEVDMKPYAVPIWLRRARPPSHADFRAVSSIAVADIQAVQIRFHGENTQLREFAFQSADVFGDVPHRPSVVRRALARRLGYRRGCHRNKCRKGCPPLADKEQAAHAIRHSASLC